MWSTHASQQVLVHESSPFSRPPRTRLDRTTPLFRDRLFDCSRFKPAPAGSRFSCLIADYPESSIASQRMS
jgi:hypothetical protein